MNGKLLVENIENGAKFVIIVPILENKMINKLQSKKIYFMQLLQ